MNFLKTLPIGETEQCTTSHLDDFLHAHLLARSDKIRLLYHSLVISVRGIIQAPHRNRLLDLGCALLQAEQALLLKPVTARSARVMATDAGPSAAMLGKHIVVGSELLGCILALEEPVNRVLGLAETGGNFSVEYNGEVNRPFVAILITPNASDTVLLCFFGDNPSALSSDDLEILELLAEGVACMIDIQKAQVQRRITDQAMFASGEVKSLEEYLQLSRLPEVYGVAGRVLEALQKRVGHSGLSIADLADDLNFSKRTLQRRLQQQDINFADLRDQVRFHSSVDYLINQHLSIDSISSQLDFSDRTSFTNAFKRWTSLSPSTFRKLFRDYV